MLMKLIRRICNARVVALASLAAVVLFMANGASAHYTKIWYWEIPDDGVWRVRWNSVFQDGQTRYSMFPRDTRQRLRRSYQQWDDSRVPNSLLTFEEVTSRSGSTDHETHPLNFNIMDSWEDVPGWYTKRMKNSREVAFAVSWLNTNWNWNSEENNWNARKADVQTIQVHELGHPTGFAHPCVPTRRQNDCDPSTVMAWIKRGTKRTLTPHDKASMADKY